MKTILFIVLFGSIGLSSMTDTDHGTQIQLTSESKSSQSTSMERVKNMELSLTNQENAANSKHLEIRGHRTRGRIQLMNNDHLEVKKRELK